MDTLTSTSAAFRALNASLLNASVVELAVDVRIVHVAMSASMAEQVASLLHDAVHNNQVLLSSIMALLPVEEVSTDLLSVECGGRVFNGSGAGADDLSQLPLSGAEALESAQTTFLLQPATVEAISTTVTSIVVATLATSVATSVATAAGGAAASAAAGAASSAAGGAAGGAGGGAAGGSSANAAVSSLTPLLFGAQRFVSASVVSSNTSSLSTGGMELTTVVIGGSTSRNADVTNPVAATVLDVTRPH